MASFDLDKINSLLGELKGLKFKEAVLLRQRLRKEKQKITIIKEQKPKVEIKNNLEANRKRSRFMKGVWRYIKLLRDRYPQLREQFTSREMFSQYFKRRRGDDVDINDVYWQNPS